MESDKIGEDANGTSNELVSSSERNSSREDRPLNTSASRNEFYMSGLQSRQRLLLDHMAESLEAFLSNFSYPKIDEV